MFDFQVPFHEQTVRYVAPEDEPSWATRSFGLHRVGWYSFARRGCMMRAFGPFGTETEAAAAGAAWMVEGVRGIDPDRPATRPESAREQATATHGVRAGDRLQGSDRGVIP